MGKKHNQKYLFTNAGKDAWEYAKRYSKRHWPKETKQYFSDIVDVIESLADDPHNYAYRDDLAVGTGLKIYGVKEHYLIFDMLSDNRIAIVAFEKKERDIPGILTRRRGQINRELSPLRVQIKKSNEQKKDLNEAKNPSVFKPGHRTEKKKSVFQEPGKAMVEPEKKVKRSVFAERKTHAPRQEERSREKSGTQKTTSIEENKARSKGKSKDISR